MALPQDLLQHDAGHSDAHDFASTLMASPPASGAQQQHSATSGALPYLPL
jgi:hypothetical protein